MTIKSGRCSLLTQNPHHHRKGKRRKRERDLLIEYKNSFTNNTDNTNNTNNKRNKTKYTKPMLSFPELGAVGAGISPAAVKQHPKVLSWPQQ